MTQAFMTKTPECLEHQVSLDSKFIHIFTDGKYDPVYGFSAFYCEECNAYRYNRRMEKDITKLAEDYLEKFHEFTKKPEITRVVVELGN